MLKRMAAIVPDAIKAGLSCNSWRRVGPVTLLATLDLIPPESENHFNQGHGRARHTRGSSRSAPSHSKVIISKVGKLTSGCYGHDQYTTVQV